MGSFVDDVIEWVTTILAFLVALAVVGLVVAGLLAILGLLAGGPA